MNEYLSDLELGKRFGVSRATIWRWTKENQFPAGIRLSSCCTRWKKEDIEAWEKNKLHQDAK